VTSSYFKRICVIAIGLTLLQGCASSSPVHGNDAAINELGGENLDLLFATEFPVASKNEALVNAARAYRDGEIDKAQLYLVRALQFDPTDANVLAQIATLHVRQGNGVLAARAFQLALQQDPAHTPSLEGMGLLYFKAGNDQQAKRYLELAIAGSADLWRSYNALGVLADRQPSFELAQSYYDKALQINPLADDVMINRGYSKYLNKQYTAAARDLHEVAERSDSEKAWRNLGLVYASQGWYEDALETFLRIEDAPAAYNATGAIAMKNGDIEEAYQYLSEAVRLSPTYFAQAEKNLAQLRKNDSRSYVN
jgi:Flp pilus assembly protein TadD